MSKPTRREALKLASVTTLTAVALAGCSQSDPFESGANDQSADSSKQTIVIGSSHYYSAEIIAEIYAQVLESKGYSVDRQFLIGAREVLIPELEAGKIDLVPDYSGNLLQFIDSANDASSREEIITELGNVLPETMEVFGESEASDQDAFNVTRSLADEYHLKTIGDLANLGRTVTVAANAEFEERPYGPAGLKEAYGIDVELTPVQDSGGPLTVKALADGTVDVANIYSAAPSIKANDFITLDDPENLILPQNVIAVGDPNLPAEVKAEIKRVLDALTQEDLIALNEQSVTQQDSAATIARGWIERRL